MFTSKKEYKKYLYKLSNTVDNPVHGFFGPGSMAWKVNREAVIAMGALRALLMQVAHPKVAQGVADHSNFRTSPFKRAYKTMHAQQMIVFGTVDQAVDTLVQIYARHSAVRGELLCEDKQLYYANDPFLQLWVHATLVDSVIRAYNSFLPPLSSEEECRFYKESYLFAQLMGIPESVIPNTIEEFNCWVGEMTTSDQIRASLSGREIAASLLRLPLPIFWPANYLLAAGSLPPKIRDEFGLKWTTTMERFYELGICSVRKIASNLPEKLRTTPTFWRAVHRTQL